MRNGAPPIRGRITITQYENGFIRASGSFAIRMPPPYTEVADPDQFHGYDGVQIGYCKCQHCMGSGFDAYIHPGMFKKAVPYLMDAVKAPRFEIMEIYRKRRRKV